MPYKDPADPALIATVRKHVLRSPSSQAELARRAQVPEHVVHRITRNKLVPRQALLKVIATLGMQLTPEGELEWNDSLAAAVSQPAALRDQLFALRRQAYEFVYSWAPTFEPNVRGHFLKQACERGLITLAEKEALSGQRQT